MSSVCSHLYQRPRGGFICEVTGKEVDPGLMPCLTNFRECPAYASRASEVQRAAPPAPAEEAEAIAPEVYKTLPEREEALPALERGAEESLEEEVPRKIKEVKDLALILNERWRAYEEEAEQLLKMWEEALSGYHYVVRASDSVIELYEKILENLDILLKEKKISEKSYNELKEKATSNLENYKRVKEELSQAFKSAERLVLPHLQRIKVTEARPEIGKLRLSLMKLEQLYREGKVSKEVYEKVKRELEMKMQRLEQLAGEAA